MYKKLTKPHGYVISFKANRLLANIIPFLFMKRDCRKLRDIEIFKKSFNGPLQEPFLKLYLSVFNFISPCKLRFLSL